MAHIDEHGGFPGFLYLFGIFDEETGREDGSQAETEKESRADFLRIFMIKYVSDDEKYEIADGFIELAGMAWQHVDALENECPRHIGWLADDFRFIRLPKRINMALAGVAMAMCPTRA